MIKRMQLTPQPVTDSLYNILFPYFHTITKTRLFKYIDSFTSKNLNFSDKKL